MLKYRIKAFYCKYLANTRGARVIISRDEYRKLIDKEYLLHRIERLVYD